MASRDAALFRVQMAYHPGAEGRFKYKISQTPDPFADCEALDNHEFLGFRTAKIRMGDFGVQTISVVPHWSICVPLTLLTAWLLLLKRRQSTKATLNKPFGNLIMGSYFKPWRRKVGVVSLVITCFFLAGWLRSFTRTDVFGIQLLNSAIEIYSDRGDFGFRRWANYEYDSTFRLFRTNDAAHAESYIHKTNPFAYIEVKRSFQMAGIHFASGRWQGGSQWPFLFLMIPYRPTVICLTLLSAYLLLSKPRLETLPTVSTNP